MIRKKLWADALELRQIAAIGVLLVVAGMAITRASAFVGSAFVSGLLLGAGIVVMLGAVVLSVAATGRLRRR